MKRRTFLKTGAKAGLVTLITPSSIVHAFRRETDTSMELSFKAPPSSARPFTWWHWMNGNVTKDGITKDLEAMAKVGIGGFQNFSVNSGIPKGPVEYLDPVWLELMEHTAKEAVRLGLEFDIHNCMGYSSSGGTWITPELSMQQLVWSETLVTGGDSHRLKIQRPFAKHGYYRDALVVAYPSTRAEQRPWYDIVEKVSINGVPISVSTLVNFDLSTSNEIGIPIGSTTAFLNLEFKEPFEIRSAEICTRILDNSSLPVAGQNARMVLETSEDGLKYSKICDLVQTTNFPEIPVIATFPAIHSKYFRIKCSTPCEIYSLRLLGDVRLQNWVIKGNFPRQRGTVVLQPDKQDLYSERSIQEMTIDSSTILDISEYLDTDGYLKWEVPPGKWTVLRFGHTTTGVTNHPAEGRGLGLECDKFSKEAFEFHFNYITNQLLPVLNVFKKEGKLGMLVDSYEVNMQNWTIQLPSEFFTRMGYSINHFIPALTGRLVDSVEKTERFLWDFRRVCADLVADNYHGRFVELCKKNDIISYTEPYNNGPFEEMQAGAKVDINMGEFWIRTSHFHHSIKLAASIQNMHGRQIVGAESFTGRPYYSKWQEYPFAMKAQGDYMFTRGLNRLIFHRYAHQPHPSALPGMTMGQWGFHFDRTNTWFNQSKAWLEYLSRCQYILQQGIFFGDIMCYTGQDAPGEDLSMGELLPEIPKGYDFQFANSEILLKRINISNGQIVLPDGMYFRLLLLPPKKTITIEVIKKIRDLVKQGMILVGNKPELTPSLRAYPNADKELSRITEELWGTSNAETKNERSFGLGRVFTGFSLQEILKMLDIKPDFEFSSSSGDSPINYIHRIIDGSDIYFVCNRRRLEENIVCKFRVAGKVPELWNADTGEISPIKMYTVLQDSVILPLNLDPCGSAIIIFRKAKTSTKQLQSIEWNNETIIGTSPFRIPQILHNNIVNDFTICLWAKPETDDFLPSGLGQGPASITNLANFAIYPSLGEVLFGAGHAIVGLLAAKNGVVVYERDQGRPSVVMIAKVPITSWTHLSVVYTDRVPSLYINGKFIKRGNQSDKIVHPFIGGERKEKDSLYYEGEMSLPEIFNLSLSQTQIDEQVKKGIHLPERSLKAELGKGKTPSIVLWQNGLYTINESDGRKSSIVISNIDKPKELIGPWTLLFPPNLGAPEKIELSNLISLHTHPEIGVKYFSGTVTYLKTFTIESNVLSNNKRVFLDLGRIAVIAEVLLNGKALGIIWKPPYHLDITDVINIGSNSLHIKVTNLWTNRLIGDEQMPIENEYVIPPGSNGINGAGIVKLPDWYQLGIPKPAGGRVTFTTWQHFNKDSPLFESGLIGPVVIRNAVILSI